MENAISEVEMNGYSDMNGDVKDDKKKRGRSPFRLVFPIQLSLRTLWLE